MAEQNEVLGISGQLDISDIQASIDKLCNNLQQVGVDADALSSRMTKALNDIAQSDSDLATKTQQAMSVLKDAMDETKKSMEDVPSMLKVAQQQVENYQASIAKLSAELSNVPQGSNAYSEITKQIEAQQAAMRLAQEDVHDLTEAYSNITEAMKGASSTYQALSASTATSAATGQAQSVTNVEVGASATAAATATGAEAAAHISNAAAATQNAEAENINAEATKNLTSSLQEYISTASGRANVERMQSENAKDLRNEIKMYEEAIKDIQSTLDSTDFSKKISDATATIEKQQSKIETYKEALANLSQENDATGEGTNYYNGLIDRAQQKITDLQAQIEGWQQQQQRLNTDLEQYNALLEAAKMVQGGETIIPTEGEKFSVDVDNTSLNDLRTQLDESKAKLQELQAEADKFSGKPLGDTQKAKLADLNKEIGDTKEKISVLQDAIKEKNEDTFVGRLRNQLSELKDKLLEFGSDLKEKVTAPFTELGNKISGSSFGQRFSAEFAQVKAGMEDFKNGAVNVITANGKLQENMGNLTKAIGGLGIPLNGAMAGIKGVTSALWGMCATPVGAVLTAIVLGLKAVHTWMTKSADGQRAYTKIMAYLGSIASSVTDIIIILGRWIYHLFADNNGPMRDFGTSFVNTFKTAVETVKNLIGGLGKTIKGIFTLDWDTFKEGLSQTGQAIKGAATTAVSAFKTTILGTVGLAKTVGNAFTDTKMQNEIGNVVNNMFSKASKAADIAGRQKQNEIDIANAEQEQASKEEEIAKSKEKIYTLTGKAKLEEIAHAKALEKEKYDKIIKLQQQRLDLQKEQNGLHEKSLETLASERNLQTQIYRTRAQAAASTRMLTRQEEAAKKALERERKAGDKADAKAAKQNEQTQQAEGKYNETLYANDQAREKVITDLEAKLADARIASMREGYAKTTKERKRQQEKELEQIKEAEEAAVEAELKRVKAEFDAQNAIRKAQGKKLLVWDSESEAKNIEGTDDVKGIRNMYAELFQLTVDKQVEDQKKAEDELIRSHQSYEEKKVAIEKKYAEDVQAINAAIKDAQKRNDKERVEALQRSLDKLTAENGKALMQNAFDELKNSPDYTIAFNDLDKASNKTLKRLIKRFSEVKDNIGSVFNPQDAKTYFDTVDKLLDELISRDPVKVGKQLTEQLTQQKKALKEAEATLSKIQNGQYDLSAVKTWKIDNSSGTPLVTPVYYTEEEAEQNVQNKRQDVDNTENNLRKVAAETTNQIRELSSAFTELGNAIGGTAGNVVSLIGDFGNFTSTTISSLNSIDKNATGFTKYAQEIQAGISIGTAFLSLATKISSTFKTSDDIYKKYADRQKKVNDLRSAVEDYRLAVLKAQQAENSWFGTTGLQRLKDSYEQHKQITEDYYNKLNEAQEVYKDKGSGISKAAMPALIAASVVAGVFTAGIGTAVVGAVAGAVGGTLAATAAVAGAAAAVGWVAGSAIQSGVDNISYKKGQTAAYNNLRIQTRHKSFWRGQKTQDLREWVKENYGEDLFEDNGLINLELANNILENYGDKLQGQTKETLEQLVKLREAYDEYQDTLQEYISDTYSPLVEDMSDAVWSWLAEGQDALQQFKDSASKTFADIGKEMIQQMLFKTVFDGFEDKLQALYDLYAQGAIDDAQLAESVGQVMGATMESAEKNLPAIEAFAEKYRDIMARYGFDVTENQEQSASAKGVTSITYDQANYLVNLATARNIALEKGNEVRRQILEALNNKGFISDYPQEDTGALAAQTTTVSPSEAVNSSDIFADIQEILSLITQGDYGKARTTLSEMTGINIPEAAGEQTGITTQLKSEWDGDNNDVQTNQSLLAIQQMISFDTSQLRISTAQIQSDISVMRDIQEQGLTQITRIEVNTRPISEILAVVQDIYKIAKDNA